MKITGINKYTVSKECDKQLNISTQLLTEDSELINEERNIKPCHRDVKACHRNVRACHRDVKAQCYQTYVRSIVEYVTLVWDPV